MTESAGRRIVVGIAGAQPSTLEFAIEEARLFGMHLEVVHCAGYPKDTSRLIDQIHFENWLEAAEHVLDEARTQVSRAANTPATGYRLSDRPPVEEFLEVSTHAAEIVLGSDNPSWFSRMVRPAVSQTLAFSAGCPVVVVPEQALTPARTHGVVVGIEGNRAEDHILRYGFDQADRRGCGLHVVHALPVESWVGEVEAHEASIAEALAGWSEKFPDVVVTRKFVRGEPTRVCARATLGAELVVIGQPRGRQIPFGLDKPMSHALLARSHGPIAIVPDSLS